MELYEYIEKYKEISFAKKDCTDIDNLIFSLLVYLDFQGIVKSTNQKITLQEAGTIYLKNYTLEKVTTLGVAQKNAYLVLEQLVAAPRYQSVTMSSYVYIADKEKQFSAITFEYDKKKIYIAFEGTDEMLSGWKENFQMSYLFPNFSQQLAIAYLNKNISIFHKKVIVGGHSKGGNLALVASMYCNRYYQYKIKKVYNNDGPGLPKEQIISPNYQRMKQKLIHFVPEYTVVGILLRNERYEVVKSTKKNIYAHDMTTWKIIEDTLEKGTLSTVSKDIETNIILWLEQYTPLEKKQIIEEIFKVLENSNIKNLLEIKGVKKSVEIINNMRHIDTKTKKLMLDVFGFISKYFFKTTILKKNQKKHPSNKNNKTHF